MTIGWRASSSADPQVVVPWPRVAALDPSPRSAARKSRADADGCAIIGRTLASTIDRTSAPGARWKASRADEPDPEAPAPSLRPCDRALGDRLRNDQVLR